MQGAWSRCPIDSAVEGRMMNCHRREQTMGGHHHARTDGGPCSGWGFQVAPDGRGAGRSPAKNFGHSPCNKVILTQMTSVLQCGTREGKAHHPMVDQCAQSRCCSLFPCKLPTYESHAYRNMLTVT